MAKHLSDCSLHNDPADIPRQCDCDVDNQSTVTEQKIITGDRAWVIIMDFCKKNAIHPANANELFELVKTIRLYEAMNAKKDGDNNG